MRLRTVLLASAKVFPLIVDEVTAVPRTAPAEMLWKTLFEMVRLLSVSALIPVPRWPKSEPVTVMLLLLRSIIRCPCWSCCR